MITIAATIPTTSPIAKFGRRSVADGTCCELLEVGNADDNTRENTGGRLWDES